MNITKITSLQQRGIKLWKLTRPLALATVLLTMTSPKAVPAAAALEAGPNVGTSRSSAISAGSSTNSNSGVGLTVTIAKPTDTVAGDVLVACILSTTAYGTITRPDTSWNQILDYYRIKSPVLYHGNLLQDCGRQ